MASGKKSGRPGAVTGLVAVAALATGAAAPARAQDAREALFKQKCAACHTTTTERGVGPGLQGVADRRSHTWLTSFITQPDRMLSEGDSIAARLLAEYQIPMPNLGITIEQAGALVAFLTAAPPGTASRPAPAVAPAGDAAEGRALFTGRRPLENGGPACLSCHDAQGLPVLGGGTLGTDLTKTAATYGDGLASVLQTTPFPVMQEVFPSHLLTTAEIANLTAFLIDLEKGAAPSRSELWFPGVGFAGTILLLVLFGALWRGRLRGARQTLSGDRS